MGAVANFSAENGLEKFFCPSVFRPPTSLKTRVAHGRQDADVRQLVPFKKTSVDPLG